MGLTLLTACFDDPQSPLLIKTPLIPGDPLTEALQSLPDEFSVCFFDEHNRELFSCKAQAKLGQLRKELGTLSPIGADHWPKMYERADRWFSLTTYEDDARATTVFLGMLRSTCCAAAASRNLHGTQRYLLKTT